MHLTSTVIFPFRLWQLFSLSPFGLSRKQFWPKECKKIELYSLVCLLVHIILVFYCLCFTSSYIDWTNSPAVVYNDIISMLMWRLLSTTIVAESILKRDKQISFFDRIKQIDNILQYKLKVQVDYANCQSQHKITSTIWCLIFVTLEIFLQLCAYMIDQHFFLHFCWYTLVPRLMAVLFCLQIVIYVRTIRRRYRLINDFLRKFHFSQTEIKYLDTLDTFEYSIHRFSLEERLSFTQLEQLRIVYKDLYEATFLVNNLCWWSLPLCLANYFHKILTLIFAAVITKFMGRRTHPYMMAIWSIFYIAQVIFLAHACQTLCKEVKQIKK